MLKSLLLLISLSFYSLSPSIQESIKPLGWTSLDSVDIFNSCTAWSVISEDEQVWVTAHHCIHNDSNQDATQFYVNRIKADIIAEAEYADLAMLRGAKAPPLKLSTRVADTTDTISMYGYPFGFTQLMYRSGVISHPDYFLNYSHGVAMIINIAIAPGDSGAPILNSTNEVISVIRSSLCEGMWEGFCAEGAGVKQVDLINFVEYRQ